MFGRHAAHHSLRLRGPLRAACAWSSTYLRLLTVHPPWLLAGSTHPSRLWTPRGLLDKRWKRVDFSLVRCSNVVHYRRIGLETAVVKYFSLINLNIFLNSSVADCHYPHVTGWVRFRLLECEPSAAASDEAGLWDSARVMDLTLLELCHRFPGIAKEQNYPAFIALWNFFADAFRTICSSNFWIWDFILMQGVFEPQQRHPEL